MLGKSAPAPRLTIFLVNSRPPGVPFLPTNAGRCCHLWAASNSHPGRRNSKVTVACIAKRTLMNHHGTVLTSSNNNIIVILVMICCTCIDDQKTIVETISINEISYIIYYNILIICTQPMYHDVTTIFPDLPEVWDLFGMELPSPYPNLQVPFPSSPQIWMRNFTEKWTAPSKMIVNTCAN